MRAASKQTATLVVGIVMIGTALVAAAPLAAADTATAGTFNAVNATRVIDTRAGIGLAKAPVGANSTVTFQAVNPLGSTAASAVELTVTAVTPERTGYLTVFDGTSTRPTTSSVNFHAGRTAANSAVVAVGAAGTVSVYNGSAGAVNLIVDATGYWTAGSVDPATAGALDTVEPQRFLDTRAAGGQPIPAQGDVRVPVAGVGPVPASGVSAVVLNATVASPTASGYLGVTQEAETPGARTSAVNFAAGASRADLVVVALATDGSITLHNGSSAPVAAVLDLVGYISDGTPVADGSLLASTGYRSNDDRVGASAIAAKTSRTYPMVPGESDGGIFKSVIATVTVVDATKPGYVVAANASGSVPATSSLNHATGETVAQTLVLPVDADGSVTLRNVSTGTVRLVIDVTGFMLKSDPQLVLDSRSDAAERIRKILEQVHHAADVRLAR